MLYDKNGSRGFLQKRPEQRSFFSSITGKETYLRYFMLDFDKRQLIIFSGDVSESLIDESGLKYQAFHMSFPKLLMQQKKKFKSIDFKDILGAHTAEFGQEESEAHKDVW